MIHPSTRAPAAPPDRPPVVLESEQGSSMCYTPDRDGVHTLTHESKSPQWLRGGSGSNKAKELSAEPLYLSHRGNPSLGKYTQSKTI